MYYIYHIKGVKIGCSDNVAFRVKSQGYDSYEILEEHTNINIASKRERELQKEYGYSIDKIPYSLTVSYCSMAGKKGGPAGKGAKSPGRSHKGEINPKAKLTNDDVIKIVELTKSGNYLQKEIASMFNVHRSAIRNIIKGRTWTHLK
jgi:hypothetical protein